MNVFTWTENSFNTKNDCILITGASSGIGLEYLKILSVLPCSIYVVSEEKEKLKNVVNELSTKSNANIIPMICDFSILSEVSLFIEQIKTLNIKILINNAGIGMKGYYVEHTVDEIDRIYNINVCTPLKILLVTLPIMLKDNIGLIIQVTTVNVATPIPYNSLYTGGKTGLSSTFSAIMYECKNTGVICHEVRPGTTESPFHEKQGVKPKAMLMSAALVAERSLNNIDKKVFMPNKIDRILVGFGSHLPLFTKMRIGYFFLKARLGID